MSKFVRWVPKGKWPPLASPWSLPWGPVIEATSCCSAPPALPPPPLCPHACAPDANWRKAENGWRASLYVRRRFLHGDQEREQGCRVAPGAEQPDHTCRAATGHTTLALPHLATASGHSQVKTHFQYQYLVCKITIIKAIHSHIFNDIQLWRS